VRAVVCGSSSTTATQQTSGANPEEAEVIRILTTSQEDFSVVKTANIQAKYLK